MKKTLTGCMQDICRTFVINSMLPELTDSPHNVWCLILYQ